MAVANPELRERLKADRKAMEEAAEKANAEVIAKFS